MSRARQPRAETIPMSRRRARVVAKVASKTTSPLAIRTANANAAEALSMPVTRRVATRL